jgi:hypothetical protein
MDASFHFRGLRLKSWLSTSLLTETFYGYSVRKGKDSRDISISLKTPPDSPSFFIKCYMISLADSYKKLKLQIKHKLEKL